MTEIFCGWFNNEKQGLRYLPLGVEGGPVAALLRKRSLMNSSKVKTEINL